MPAKKKTPPPAPITVADLLLALASYPQDATIGTSDPFIPVLVYVADDAPEGEVYELIEWQGGDAGKANHYQRADVVREIIHRNSPGDDFDTAQEFLEWLGKSDMVLRHPGHGHNELDGPVRKSAVELAEEFARRAER